MMNLRRLLYHIIPTKWRSYRDHRFFLRHFILGRPALMGVCASLAASSDIFLYACAYFEANKYDDDDGSFILEENL